MSSGRRVPFGRFLIRAILPGAGLILVAQSQLQGQDSFTITRGDEPGDRDFKYRDETFLNILSYRQPLESIQPWLVADSGLRTALGSLSKKLFWMENEFKVKAHLSETLSFSSHALQGVDFDTSFTQIQGRAEWEFIPGLSAVAPGILQTNKGRIAAGLGCVVRDPEREIDFIQLSWVRSFILFNEKEDFLGDSYYSDYPDTLEFQAQGNFLQWGTTTFKAAHQFASRIRYVEEGRIERFRRFSAGCLQRIDLENGDTIFLDFMWEDAAESVRATEDLALVDSFEASRYAVEARLEYQRPLSPDGVRRIRSGLMFFRFNEDAAFAHDSSLDRGLNRREQIVYGAYRFPIGSGETTDLELAAYLDGLASRVRFPHRSDSNEEDPRFQGKLSLYFRWRLGDGGHFILNAAIDLDQFAWGGGGVQLAYSHPF